MIRPRKSLLDVNLKEVWKYRDLITLFVRRDWVSQYKQTILGPLWYIINPALTTIVYTFIFGRVAQLSTDGLPHTLFYMSGVVVWNYFSTCITRTSDTFRANANIFGKVYFPRLVTPVSAVISSLLQLAVQLLLLVGVMVYFYLARGQSLDINGYILLLPVLIGVMALMGLGFGIIISSLTTKYRDLSNLVSFGMRLWMYATPVIYPLSEIPAQYQNLVAINPMVAVVETFRYGLLGAGTIRPGYIVYTLVFTVAVLFIGILLFNKIEKNFMDTV